MNRVDRIVELIDHALDDYGAGEDAMRWTPQPVADGTPWTGVAWQWTTSWSDSIVWNPGPPIMVNCNEMVVCDTSEREEILWLTLRPIPPAESVTIDLSVWD